MCNVSKTGGLGPSFKLFGLKSNLTQFIKVKAIYVNVMEHATGVSSAALGGEDNSQIVVKGENIDMIELVKKLKKKVGFSHILTVTLIDQDKKGEDEDEDDEDEEPPKVWPNFHPTIPPYYFYEVPGNRPDTCTIL